MEQYFFIDANNQQQGPVDVNELRKLGVTKETLVWKEGMRNYTAAKKIPELGSILHMLPPTPPKTPTNEKKEMDDFGCQWLVGIIAILILAAICYFWFGWSILTSLIVAAIVVIAVVLSFTFDGGS